MDILLIFVLSKKRSWKWSAWEQAKRIFVSSSKAMSFTALLSQVYVFILYVCKALVAFRGEQFSCSMALGSIYLLLCCCYRSLSDWVCTMLMSVLIRSYFVCSVVSLLYSLYVAEVLFFFYYKVKLYSSFSIQLSCYLPIITSDTSIVSICPCFLYSPKFCLQYLQEAIYKYSCLILLEHWIVHFCPHLMFSTVSVHQKTDVAHVCTEQIWLILMPLSMTVYMYL